jgi:hypothetical protein
MRPVTFGGVCRNYRPRPPAPGGDVKRIPLGDGLYAYIDAADYDWLSRYNWYLANGYAGRRDKGKQIYMHREITKAPMGIPVDHINHNRLDNSRPNLRVCTFQQNSLNNKKRMGSRSRFKGVTYDKRYDKWCARITSKGGRFWLGWFDTEIEAARAYDRKAVEVHGEFARLNFPEEWPPERRQALRAQQPARRRKTNVTAKKAKGKCNKHRPRRKASESPRRSPGTWHGLRPQPESSRAETLRRRERQA